MKQIPLCCNDCGEDIGVAWVADHAADLPGVVIERPHECSGVWAA